MPVIHVWKFSNDGTLMIQSRCFFFIETNTLFCYVEKKIQLFWFVITMWEKKRAHIHIKTKAERKLVTNQPGTSLKSNRYNQKKKKHRVWAAWISIKSTTSYEKREKEIASHFYFRFESNQYQVCIWRQLISPVKINRQQSVLSSTFAWANLDIHLHWYFNIPFRFSFIFYSRRVNACLFLIQTYFINNDVNNVKYV